MSYAKLHGEMLASSIWSESDTTRLVWVTMLMMSDRDGLVRASLTGLAHQARVSVEACTAALKTLTGPDPESRDRTSGERVVEVVGGYQILNYERYQELCSADDKREKAAQRQQRKRDRDRKRHAPSRRVTESSHVTPSAYADTHADADARVQNRASALEIDPGFVKFWDAYQKKVDRPEALKAWRKIAPDHDLLALILAAVPPYVESTPDKNYRKHPAVWLRRCCWQDEVIKPANTNGRASTSIVPKVIPEGYYGTGPAVQDL